MKKIISRILFLPLLLLTVIACNDEREGNGNGTSGDAIFIHSGILTKAVDTNWQSGDAIGVTLYEEDYSQIIDGVYNTRYVTGTNGPNGEFTAATADETLYFPQDGRDIRIKSYYPWQAGVPSNMLLDWEVTNQEVLPRIDLMTAEHTTGFSKTDTDVDLTFYHRLSKLIFNLSIDEDGDFVDLDDCTLHIRGMQGEDTYDLFNDVFLHVNNGTADITVPLRTGEADNYRQAIVLPRSAGNGVSFEFVTPTGDTYIAYMSDTLELKGGHQYTFNLNFLRTPITVGATIQPWVEEGPYDYDVVRVSTPAGPTTGVEIGDVMNVYIQTEDGSTFELLKEFTYTATNTWTPNTVAYWEDIPQDPAILRSSIIAAPALNATQLPDILISDTISVPHYEGANFTLSHAASKAIIQVHSTTFFEQDITNATIVLPDYLTGGYENLGVFVPGTTREDITVDRSNTASGVALFQPQTIAANNPLVTVTINGREYNATDPGGFTFEAGVAYEITITVNKEEVTVSVTVTDWETESIDLTAVTVGTVAGTSAGVEEGEELLVYTGDATTRELLNTYTYSQGAFTSGTTIYWEDLANPTTFYGYIERAPAYNSTQVADYLVGAPVTVNANNGINFNLSHAAAQVVVQLVSTDSTFSDAELRAMDIILPQYRTGATMNDGVFVPGATDADVTVAKNVGINGNSAIALIQPQDRSAGSVVVEMRSNGQVYTATYNQTISFQTNVSTTLRVDMSKTGISISAIVSDWETGQTIDMVASALHVGGTLGTDSDFFENKSIYVYDLNTTPPTIYTYTYELKGTAYAWDGPKLFWEDQPGTSLNWGAIYYPVNNQPIPTGTTFPWSIAADQSDPANQYYGNYDLLMSRLTLSSPEYVNLVFKHVTARVVVRLKRGTGFEPGELDGAEVKLTGFRLSGTADLNTATLTPTGTATANLTPQTYADGEEYRALVMPQTRNRGDNILTVTLPAYPGLPFIGQLTGNLNFPAGYTTYIDVTLNKTAIELSATLEPWIDGDTGEIEIH